MPVDNDSLIDDESLSQPDAAETGAAAPGVMPEPPTDELNSRSNAMTAGGLELSTAELIDAEPDEPAAAGGELFNSFIFDSDKPGGEAENGMLFKFSLLDPEMPEAENPDDMYEMYDRLPEKYKKQFRYSPEAMREFFRSAPPERQAEYKRLIFGRMETAEALTLDTPEGAEQIREASAKLGMPTDMVRWYINNDPKRLNNMLTNADVVNKSGTAGYFTSRLQEPDQAQLLRYDAATLAQMEADWLGVFGTTGERLRYDVGVGLGQVGSFALRGMAAVAKMGADFADWEYIGADQTTRDMLAHSARVWNEWSKNAEAEWLGPAIDTGNPVTDWLRTSIFQGTPFLAGSAALAMIPGVGAPGAAGIIASGMGAEAYGEVREAGGTPAAAAVAAGVSGIASYFLNRFQLERWTRNLAGRAPLRVFSVRALAETGQEILSESGESLAQGVSIATAKFSTPGYDRDQWWLDVKESAGGAFQEGAAAGVLSMATQLLGLPPAMRAQGRSYAFNRMFKRVNRQASETAVGKKNPGVIAVSLNGMARHHGNAGVVFTSVLELQQGGLSKEDITKPVAEGGLGIDPQEYEYHRDHNVDLAIPYGNAVEFAKNQREAGNSYYEDVFRPDPDAMTGKEILVQQKAIEDTLAKAEQHFKALADSDDSGMPLRIRIFRAGLRAANFDANEADAGAAMFLARAEMAADLWGESVEEWLERHDVQLEMRGIVRNGRAQAQRERLMEQSRARRDMASGYVSPDPAVAATQTVDVFEQAEQAFGPVEAIDEAVAAPEPAGQEVGALPQPGVAEDMIPVVDEADNRQWVESVVDEIAAVAEAAGEDGTVAAEAARELIDAGLDVPEVQEIVQEAKAQEAAASPAAEAEPGGRRTKIIFPAEAGQPAMPARYAVVELSTLQPSHVFRNYTPNPAWTGEELAQQRNYDSGSMESVRQGIELDRLDFDALFNPATDAVNGPPIVTPAGKILGGNNRSHRIYNRYAADGYRDNLVAYLDSEENLSGIRPEAVLDMEQPVLVRVVDDVDAADIPGIIGALNADFTNRRDAANLAANRGMRVGERTLAAFAGINDQTVAGYLDSPETARRFLELNAMRTQREVAEYFTRKADELSGTARGLFDLAQGPVDENSSTAENIEQLKRQEPADLRATVPVTNKAAVKDVFRSFGPVMNRLDGRSVLFPAKSAGKIEKHRGFDMKQVVAAFDRLFAEAIPMFSEPEIQREGHKPHNNIAAYHHYVSKFTHAGTEGNPATYYVRFTVQEMKSKKGNGENLVHSAFVSDVSAYEESALSGWGWESPVIAESGAPVDHKLAQWLSSVKSEDGGKSESEPFDLAQGAIDELYSDLPEGVAAQISSFFDRVAQEPRDKFIELILENAIRPAEVAAIREKTGLDVTGFKRTLDNYGVIHALRQHGLGSESDPTQAPITKDDFSRIPEVVSNPDDITYRQRKGTADTLTFTKDMGGVTYVVEEVRSKAKKLAFKTMYKKIEGDWQNPTGSATSTSAMDSESPSRVSIHDGGGKVKSVDPALDELRQTKDRGRTRFPQYANAPTIISLFRNADISTVVHELNHLFVFDLEQLVASGRGGDRARADWAALVAFTKGDLESDDPDRKRNGYEMAAEAWERWAMEGNAPSPALVPAFDTFRTYMTRIYQNAKTLPRFEPSPAVRAVFERFLASDSQIAEARRLSGETERWYDAAVKDEVKRQELRQAELAAENERRHRYDARQGGGRAMRDMGDVSDLRRRMGKEVSNIPVYRALDAAKRKGGMNRLEVEALIGEAGAKELADRHGEDVFGSDAWLADVAAESGYQDVRAMLADMASVRTFGQEVDSRIADNLDRQDEADRQREMDEGGLGEDDGSDAEEQSLVMQIEESIRERGGGARALREWRIKYAAMKAAASKLLGSKSLREAVDVRQFEKARREASRKALQAAKRGQIDKVTEQLNLELMHHLTIKEAMRARNLREKVRNRYGTRALLDTLNGTGGDEHRARVENAYAEAIKAIASFMGFTHSRRLRPQHDSQTIPFPTYEAGSNVAGFLPDMAGSVEPWLLNKTYPVDFQDWRDFTYDQIKEADRVLTMLIEQGQGKLHSLREADAATLGELIAKSVEPMERRESRPAVDNDDRTWLGNVLNRANRFLISLTCPEYWFMAMDGNPTIQGKQSGVNQRLFWKMRDCQLEKDRLYKAALADMGPHLGVLMQAKRDLEAQFGGKQFVVPGVRVPDVLKKGRNYSTFDADALLSIALMMGNDASLYRLTGIRKNSDGRVDVDYREDCYNFTEEELARIARLFTADQWRAIQGVWDGLDALYPKLDEVTFRITNRHVVKEPAQANVVETRDGQTVALRGGYFPLINDSLLNIRSDQLKEGSSIEDAIYQGAMDNIHQSTKPAAGMTKARLRDEDGNPVVRLPQILKTNLIIKHLDAATHYISHAETILEFDRLTRNDDWRKAYIDKFGHERYRAIRSWVQDLARPNRTNNSPGQEILEQMRTLATINALGLRPTTAAKQQLGLFQAAAFMSDASRTKASGWKYIKKGWREIGWGALVGQKTDKMEWVDSLSQYMAARDGAHDREINATISRLSPLNQEWTIPGTNKTVNKKDLHDGMFKMIQISDRVAAYTTWIGAYEQAMAGEANFDIADMSDAKRHEESVRYADSAAATQASSFAADLTAAQRDTGIMRFVSMFMSGNIRQGSRLFQYVDAYRMGDVNASAVSGLAFREFVAPAVAWIGVRTAILYGLAAAFGGDPDEDDLLTEAIWEVVETSMAPFPIARELPSWVRYGAKGELPALSAPSNAVNKGIRGVKRLAEGRGVDAAADMADFVGFWTGVPAMNLLRQTRPIGEAIGVVDKKKGR